MVESQSTSLETRLTIAKAAVGIDKPGRPYEVRANKPIGLLLRVQPSGTRTYYVQVSRGRRVKIGPAGTFTLKQAADRAKKILIDPAAFAKSTGDSVTLVAYLNDTYSDHALARLKNGAQSVARVKAVWTPLLKKRLIEVSAASVDTIRNKRLNAGVAAATVNRDVAALSGVLAHWVEHTPGAVHPLAGLETLRVADDETIRYLTPSESKRLRECLTQRDRTAAQERDNANMWRAERDYPLLTPITTYCDHITPMVLLSLNTGLRQGELFSLAWSSVDLRLKTITVLASHSKGNNTRTIPLNTEALAVLTSIQPSPAAGLVFKSPVTGGRFNNVKKAWAELTQKAGIPDLRWHDLRHDFASQLVMRGVPLFTVQKLLGHSNARMTQRYAKLAPGALADAVNLLNGGVE